MLRTTPPIYWILLFSLLAILSACSTGSTEEPATLPETGGKPAVQMAPSSTPSPSATLTPTSSPTVTQTPTVTATPTQTPHPMSIPALRQMTYPGSEIIFEDTLEPGANYNRYYVSYMSEGLKQYGLLTIPYGETPPTGWPAIVFNHGYIPPDVYRTTERYAAYVNYLARSGFVVFKIDYRGHGNSEGYPSGSYFSPGYTIDSIAALKSLQMLDSKVICPNNPLPIQNQRTFFSMEDILALLKIPKISAIM